MCSGIFSGSCSKHLEGTVAIQLLVEKGRPGAGLPLWGTGLCVLSRGVLPSGCPWGPWSASLG